MYIYLCLLPPFFSSHPSFLLFFLCLCLSLSLSVLVYKVLDPNHKIYALKDVDLKDAEKSTVESYMNEISLLEKLNDLEKLKDQSKIIKVSRLNMIHLRPFYFSNWRYL